MIKLSELTRDMENRLAEVNGFKVSPHIRKDVQAMLEVFQKHVCIQEEGTEPIDSDIGVHKRHLPCTFMEWADEDNYWFCHKTRKRLDSESKVETIKHADGRPVLTVEKE